MGIWTRKTIGDATPDAHDEASPTLLRVLTARQLAILGVGSTIGAGVFVITGTAAAEYAGPAIAISFLLAALACLCTAFCYGELASMIPYSGGAYSYAYATLGELVAWIIGWCLVLEYLVCCSTIAVGWSGYFSAALARAGLEIPLALRSAPIDFASGHTLVTTGAVFNVPAALMVLAMTALLLAGIRESARANTLFVTIKVGIILLVIGFGVWHVDATNWQPFVPPNSGTWGEFGWSGVFRGAGVIFFAFIGFDGISTSAQEARNPQRDLGVAILWALAICTALYVGMALVITGLADYSTLRVPNPVSVALAAADSSLRWLVPLVDIAAVVGLASAVFMGLYGQTRIFYAMASDGLIPPLFARLHPTRRVPFEGTVIVGVACALLGGVFPLDILGELVSIGTLLAFTIVCTGVLVLRRTEPQRPRAFRVPLVPFMPLAGIAACLYLMASLPIDTWARLAYWLGLGLAIYFFYGRRRSTAAALAPARETL
jgi:basic amino acid/polyamine antiporter, APA family